MNLPIDMNPEASPHIAPAAQEGEAQHRLIEQAAERMGMQITDVSDHIGKRASLLEWDGHVELLVAGIPTSWMSMQTRFMCDLKQFSKEVFQRLSVPSPASIFLTSPDESVVRDFLVPGKKYVCKPESGANGIGVKMNLETVAEVVAYMEENGGEGERFLLEEQVEGNDIRIQVIGGKIVAACIREPAFVVGDGEKSLEQLVEERRMEMRMENPSNRLDLDEVSLRLLREAELTLASVPAPGQKVVLKTVNNIGQGGVATDITEELHPRYHDWIARIGHYISSSYFALDLIGGDPDIDPATSCIALEINAQAEWMHHTFSRVRTHDLAAVIVRQLIANQS